MDSTIDWKNIAANFPVNDSYIWLNNAGYVPSGKHVIDAMHRFLDAYSLRGVLDPDFQFLTIHTRIKTVLAQLLGCSSEDVALIHNTAEGINFISHGLALNVGDEVLLLEQEYPSNVYPWEHLKEKGVHLSFVPNTLTGDDFIQNFKNSISPRTKVAALSAVHWCTGMPLPLQEISSICKDHHIELVVDMSQGAGHIPLHIDDWGISFCVGSSWKWLQGPLGLGILIIKKEKIPSLSHVFKGTNSVVSEKKYLPYKNELKQTADRYVYSTPSLIDWVYLDASLSYLAEIGFNVVHSRIFTLSEYLCNNLVTLGFSVLNRKFAPAESGIVVAEHGGKSSGEIVRNLKALNIICADRANRVRFSVHICNTFDQIDKVISVLREIV